jgi:hypothetical protein
VLGRRASEWSVGYGAASELARYMSTNELQLPSVD